MSFRKYGLPIFLLYFITSLIFLGFFTKIYYNVSHKNITDERFHEIINVIDRLNFLARNDLNLANFELDDDDIEVNIFDLKKGVFVRKEFDEDELNFTKFDEIENIFPNKFDKKFDDFNQEKYQKNGRNFDSREKFRHQMPKIAVEDDDFYALYFMKNRRGEKMHKITIKSDDYMDEITELRWRAFFIFLGVFALYLLIAYFIIKLSFRPLLEKISSLNSFIKDTTHEINTPLSVILMSVEMFDKNPQKYLQNIKVATKNLSNLHSDLVSINLKSDENHIQNIDILGVVKEKIAYFDLMLKSKNITISPNLSPCEKLADPNKFGKIIDNLFSNAIKYCDMGSEISLFLDEKNFIISNIGEAISDENKGKIFDKFARFSANQSGFGIGLSLVKKYCDEMKFDIFCETQGKKTTFILKFNQ